MKYKKSLSFRSIKTSRDFNLSDFSRFFDPNFHKRIENSFKY